MGGRVDMVMVERAAESLNYAREDLPFLCIGADLPEGSAGADRPCRRRQRQLREAQGQDRSWSALAARVSYWPFLKAKYGYSDDQMKPYTFNLAPFLADKNLVQQGFVSSEPYAMRQAGADPDGHADRRCRFRRTTTPPSRPRRSSSTEKKDVVQRFVTASLEGWSQLPQGRARHRGGQCADQEGQPRHDRRQDRLCDQGHERKRHCRCRATR